MENERDLNIILVGIDLNFARKVAKELASRFFMYYLDSHGLYEFDIQPHTFSYVLKKYGIEYFRTKQTDTMKYVSSFSNTVILVESGTLLYQNNIDILSKDGVVVYIKQPLIKLYKSLANQDYSSKEELKFFKLEKKEIVERDEVLSNVAEVVVEDNSFDVKICVEKIIEGIECYYGVK